MNAQRRFDIDSQPSLFDDTERDQLDAIAEQCTEEDRAAWRKLGRMGKD